MTRLFTIPGFIVACGLGLGGCDEGDDDGCARFAEHLADVLQREKGGEIDPELRAKMVHKTTASCAESPPDPKTLACALAARDSAGIKACDPSAEAE
jgi:hypothetical protein